MAIAEKFNQVSREYSGRVDFGSYPVFDNSQYKVKITIEANDENDLKEVRCN